jgi:uncharacterized protein
MITDNGWVAPSGATGSVGFWFCLTAIRNSRMNTNRAFDWDDAKAASNLAKHGVRFDFAIRAFVDVMRIDVDASRLADAEARRKVIGMINGLLFTVVHTRRPGMIRIISARRSNAKESRAYGSVYP